MSDKALSSNFCIRFVMASHSCHIAAIEGVADQIYSSKFKLMVFIKNATVIHTDQTHSDLPSCTVHIYIYKYTHIY